MNFIEKAVERKEKVHTYIKTPIARIDDDVFKSIRRARAGKKRKFSPVKLKNEVNKFFEHCEKKDEIPSIKGLCIFVKMSRGSFDNYKTYPEFVELVEYVEMIIDHWCENDVYKTPGQASGKIAYMKNVHGWREKQEIEHVTPTYSVEDARAKLEALLPDLLNHIKRLSINQELPRLEVIEIEAKDVTNEL